MKKLSKLTFLSIAIIMLMQVFLPTISCAILIATLEDKYVAQTEETEATKILLGIQNVRPYSDDDGNKSNDDTYGFFANNASQTVFKIGERKGTSLTFDNLYYCLKWGIGFGTGNENDLDHEYKYSGNLLGYTAETQEVKNALCWLADHVYLPNYIGNEENENDTAENMKSQLLNAAGITNSKLTDDDIDVVQQFAIWYFINDSDIPATNDLYNILHGTNLPSGQHFDLGKAMLKINGESYINQEDANFNSTRAEQINTLFNYFITNATNAGEPTNSTPEVKLNDGITASIEEKTLTVGKLQQDVFVVGPFKIETDNLEDIYNFSYTLKCNKTEDSEGTPISIDNEFETVYISDKDGNSIADIKDIKDTINEGEFYITITKDDELSSNRISELNKFQLNVSYDYYKTLATVWTATEESQPVLKVEKELVPMTDSVEVENVEIKEFDLSLRKFISGITRNGTNVEFESREPRVDTSTLIDGFKDEDGNILEYTATYTHSKEPIYLNIGDIIEYTIRVYNEGEIAGTATKITDYLPEYLDFVDCEANEDWDYDDDTRTVTTEVLSSKSIAPFNAEDEGHGEGLSYEDVKIVCQINDKANPNNSIINIAEISGYSEDDRDSQPGNVNVDSYNTNLDDNSTYQQDDDDFEIVEILTGEYKVEIQKVDSKDTNKKLSNAEINVKLVGNEGTEGATYPIGEDGTYSITVPISEVGKRTYELKETVAPSGYKCPEGILGYITVETGNTFTLTGAYLSDKDGNPLDTENSLVTVSLNGSKITITIKNEPKIFDLSLRKYITAVSKDVEFGEENTVTYYDEGNRTPDIDTSKLNTVNEDGETITTAEYAHRKDPVEVTTGDYVKYNLTVYNEGEIAGRATKIIDQLPTGLEFVKVAAGNYEVESYDEGTNTLTLKETESNQNLAAYNGGETLASTTVTIICQVTAEIDQKDKVFTNIAWISEDYNEEGILDRDSEPGTVPAEAKQEKTAEELVTEDIGYTGKESHTEQDLENSNEYFEGQQDDDDFEKVIIRGKEFDLSLRKFISKIERNGEDVKFDPREPKVNTETLVNGIENEKGEIEHTATYTHSKESLTVKQGDIITYTLRVYNEGNLDGYASEITDYLPEGLGLLWEEEGKINEEWSFKGNNVEPSTLAECYNKMGKKIPTTGMLKDIDAKNIQVITRTDKDENDKLLPLQITNSSLDDAIIKRYGAEIEEGDNWQKSSNDENDGLFYQEVEVTCIVLADPTTFTEKIVNIAEISKNQAVDENGNNVSIEDRDSIPGNADLDKYDLNKENSTYQEDDDDYEPIELKYFDLALRKFISDIERKGEAVEFEPREPEVKIDNEGNIAYEHSKKPLGVVGKDVVTYTIRVYNEGTLAGFAEEIEDDIPEGLVFLPEHGTNVDFGWKMYRPVKEDDNLEDYKEEEVITRNNIIYVLTKDPSEATIIRTDYLSSDKGTVDEETKLNSNLLNAFNGTTLDYKEVKVAFKVSQSDIPEDNEDRIIINKAHITKDSDDDNDSTPDKWNEGEDDQDREYIYVQEFDLALFKWVSQTSVTVDGQTTVTETGFKPNVGETEAPYKEDDSYRSNEDEEPIASVTIDKKKLSKTVVKFTYNIKVVNEGDIPGYATEITDYIPEGLEFIAEDEVNSIWTIGEKDGTITTKALDTILLKPGESATIPVVFTWKNDPENLGVKTNVAAITQDYNDEGVEDIDSTPGNEEILEQQKEQEDDDDYALVILELKTGKNMSYLGIVLAFTTIVAAGAISIKKYVL